MGCERIASGASAPATNVRRAQDGQATPLAASSSSTHLRVRLRPASLPDDAPDRPQHRQRPWPEH